MVLSIFSNLAVQAQGAAKVTFGEDVIYSPSDGDPVEGTGVFSKVYEIVDPDTENLVSSDQPVLGIKDDDFPKVIEKNELFTIRGKNYRVRDSQADGEGWSRLFLYEVPE